MLEYAYRPVSLHPAAPIPASPMSSQMQALSITTSRIRRHAIVLGLGSLVHLLQTFVSDAGTIIAWTWTGYPITGPTLHPFAGVVIAITAIAVAFSGRIMQLSANIRSLSGLVAAVTLYAYPDWLGFVGGLMLIAYLITSTPTYLQAVSTIPSGLPFGHALLVKCLLDVASVITAAYAFVPYGWLLRERTDLVLGFCMISVVAGEYAAKDLLLPDGKRLHMRSRLRMKMVDRWTQFLCLGLSVVALGYSYGKMPTSQPVPYYPEHRIFSGGIWAVSSLESVSCLS